MNLQGDVDLRKIDKMETSLNKLELKFQYANKYNCFDQMSYELHESYELLKLKDEADMNDWNRLINKYKG